MFNEKNENNLEIWDYHKNRFQLLQQHTKAVRGIFIDYKTNFLYSYGDNEYFVIWKYP